MHADQWRDVVAILMSSRHKSYIVGAEVILMIFFKCIHDAMTLMT